MTNDWLQGKQWVFRGKRKQSSLFPAGPVTLTFILFSIFSYISTRKWLQKNYFFVRRLAHTFAAVSRWTTLSRESRKSSRCLPWGKWILFTLKSWWILIHGSSHVQPSNQKTYMSRALHIYIALKSFRQVKNYIMLLAPISYFSFKFQLTEIPILATVCAPWKKTLPLWRTRVGYVGAFFIPHACLQLGG